MNLKKKRELARQLSDLLICFSPKERQEILIASHGLGRDMIPISAFRSGLSGLQAIIRYLKDSQETPFSRISDILNRKLSTIYNTYRASKLRLRGMLDLSDSSILIPLDMFKDTRYSVLESVSYHLRKTRALPFDKIASSLKKSSSTVKTAYKRYMIKKCAA
ncbi:hypothetical protein KY358_00320 [Candidatus Woesearchaeota archaeon]|nr:hypothetical protein [Candidatus Woesearchaeota archaeon]